MFDGYCVVCGQPGSNILAYGGHGGSGVGLTLEVSLHHFVMGENGCREAGKNPRVGNARRRIRIWCWCRGDVGGKAPPLREKVKMEVERWEKW